MPTVIRPQGSVSPPKKLRTGTISVGTTRVAGPNIRAHPEREVVLSCPISNTASVFVGDENVTPTTGLEIEPGGGALVMVENLNQLYFVAAEGTQTVRYAVETS